MSGNGRYKDDEGTYDLTKRTGSGRWGTTSRPCMIKFPIWDLNTKATDLDAIAADVNKRKRVEMRKTAGFYQDEARHAG